MSRIYVQTLNACNCLCPNFQADDGGGHCDGYSRCKATQKYMSEIRDDYNGRFPDFCPLKELPSAI